STNGSFSTTWAGAGHGACGSSLFRRRNVRSVRTAVCAGVSAELGVTLLAFVGAVCLLSGFAHGALGFGFPMLATPLVALAIGIKPAIALLAPITLVL